MKVVGLDGREYIWPPRGHDETTQGELQKSKLHLSILEFLKLQFPGDMILQELPLPGSSVPPLRVDFYLPLRKLVVEADGEQHYKFVPFFHKNKMGYLKSMDRDKKKKNWLETNGILLLRLPERADWECLLKNALSGSTTN